MKQGKFAIIITCFLYGVAILLIMTGTFGLNKPFVGKESLILFEELSVADKVGYYLSQSARNALYLTNEELKKELFDKEKCTHEQEKVVLFSQGSCELDFTYVKQRYLDRFMTHFTPLLEEDIYGVKIREIIAKEHLSFDLEERKVQVTGIKSHAYLNYQGKEVTYVINPSFKEEAHYALQDYLLISQAVGKEIKCMAKHTTNMALACPLPATITWKTEAEGDYLFITATTKNNIAFSFAINLKTIQEPDTSLFA